MRAPGESIDIWVVEKALGSGGMGSVYRCHNRSATRILAAVKVLDIHIRKGSGAEERFIREAEILFRVDHPNVVKVRNIRTDTEPPYLEMEFVEGESLEAILGRGPLPLSRALALFGQLADAVAYLHALGIRHRDIKPQNVLVRPDGTLKLVDFGLAMEADASRITQQGTTFGTVSYAPPEWVNESLDPVKWDTYALGVVCWEMLTGDVAFPVSGQGSARQQAMQVMLAKQNHAPLDPGEGFPKPLRDLIADLTRADANVRLRDAAQIIQRLRAIDPNLAVAQRGPSPLPRREADTWVDPTGGARIVDGVLLAETPARAPTPPETLPAAATIARPTRAAPQTQTMSLEPPAARRQSRAGVWVIAAALAALLAAVVVLGASGVAALALLPPAAQPRAVDVVVGGLAEGTPVAVALDGQPPIGQDAWVYHFAPVPAGPHEVHAVIGVGCQPCLTGAACPDGCVSQPVVPVEVVDGDGNQAIPVALTPPPRREVPIEVLGAPPGLRLEVEGVDVPLGADQRGNATLAPGDHPAKLATCATDCPTEGCPPGCAEVFETIHVPAGEPALVRLTAPAAWAPVAAPVKPSSPRPAPADPKAPTASRLVTNAELAAWLAPRAAEWGRDAAIAAARAEGSYLDGWADLTPPPGREREPALNVSWYAADAYCRSRGGLAHVDAEPLRWDDRQPAFYEWRQTSDGAPMFRGADGTQGLQRTKKSTNSLTGFRCAR